MTAPDQTVRRHRIALPRWDVGRSGTRTTWEPLQGNTRAHWRRKSDATRQVITDVTRLAMAAKIPTGSHITVTLTWAPGDRRKRDADNLWPLLKVICDALARGPRKDLPGLRLVPDDSPEYMTKHAPVIAPPPANGLWLDLEVTT